GLGGLLGALVVLGRSLVVRLLVGALIGALVVFGFVFGFVLGSHPVLNRAAVARRGVGRGVRRRVHLDRAQLARVALRDDDLARIQLRLLFLGPGLIGDDQADQRQQAVRDHALHAFFSARLRRRRATNSPRNISGAGIANVVA